MQFELATPVQEARLKRPPLRTRCYKPHMTHGRSHWPLEDLLSVNPKKFREHRNVRFQEGQHYLPLTHSTRKGNHGVSADPDQHAHQLHSPGHGELELSCQGYPRIRQQCN